MEVTIKKDEIIITRKEYAALFSCALAVKTAHEYNEQGILENVAKSVLELAYKRTKEIRNL